MILLFSTSILNRVLALLKNAKLIRITRLNKVIKIFNGIRSIKILNFIVVGFSTLN